LNIYVLQKTFLKHLFLSLRSRSKPTSSTCE